MLTNAFLLLVSSAAVMLRMGDNASSFPRPLRAAEEREAIAAMLAGDEDARNKLIEHNLRLVMHIIKKYYARTGDTEDLVSIGTIGLIKGVSTYRPDKGVRLATYASRCIENEILMYFRGQKKSAGDVSLSGGLEGAEEDDGLSILDTIADDVDLLENVTRAESIQQLRQVMRDTLDERETEVVRLRYGLNGSQPLAQREVAERLGISRSYISRIEKKALEKLRLAILAQEP